MTIRAITKQLNLWGNEAFLFEYLANLYYYGQVWDGTMEKLGEETRVGSKQTISRTIDKLAKLGLVEKIGMTIRLINQNVLALIGTKQFQNETPQFQSETPQFQNGTESKEKEKKQKNKEIMKDTIKDKESESNNPLALYKIILQKGYLHPKGYVDRMTSYYDVHGWPNSSKTAVMRNWMMRELQFDNKPQMDEQAAAFIGDMVDVLPDYQESFCDALEAVKMEQNKVVLYVPEHKKVNIGNWLNQLDLSPLIRRYRVEIALRPFATQM